MLLWSIWGLILEHFVVFCLVLVCGLAQQLLYSKFSWYGCNINIIV